MSPITKLEGHCDRCGDAVYSHDAVLVVGDLETESIIEVLCAGCVTEEDQVVSRGQVVSGDG